MGCFFFFLDELSVLRVGRRRLPSAADAAASSSTTIRCSPVAPGHFVDLRWRRRGCRSHRSPGAGLAMVSCSYHCPQLAGGAAASAAPPVASPPEPRSSRAASECGTGAFSGGAAAIVHLFNRNRVADAGPLQDAGNAGIGCANHVRRAGLLGINQRRLADLGRLRHVWTLVEVLHHFADRCPTNRGWRSRPCPAQSPAASPWEPAASALPAVSWHRAARLSSG